MGWRFRKSIRILPGVKINLNKKSTSVTIGGKGAKKTISSTGRKTTTIGFSGTGVSYSFAEKSTQPEKLSSKIPSQKTCKLMTMFSLAFFLIFLFVFLWFFIDYLQKGYFMDAIFAGTFGGFTIGFFTSYRRFGKLLNEHDRKAEQLQLEIFENKEEEKEIGQ